MLLAEKELLDLLRCPKSGAELIKVGNKLRTIGNGRECEYDIINGYPILIDFECSILSRDQVENLASTVERRSYKGLFRIAKRLVSPLSARTMQNVKHLTSQLSGQRVARVLIIGGGTVGDGMEPFYTDSRIEVVSFDIYGSPMVQFLADAHRIPLPSRCFDAVICQAVLEHVLDPVAVVSEIHRVLKPDGIVYAETPFLQHVHEGPYDFTRFTDSGHRYLFKNFDLIESGTIAGAGTQLMWSLDNFFRGLTRSKRIGKAIKLCCFWLAYLDRLIPEAYNIDSASGVFFLGRKRAKPIDPKEMVAHYKGAQ